MATEDIRFAQPKAPREQLVLISQSLDEVVTPDDPVRAFEALLDEIDWGPWEQAYTGYGQPPIHPRYLAGAILYGLLHKARSSRDLEEAGRKHVDFIWLLEGFTPDHSTFAKFRQRHAEAINDLHRHIAEALVTKRETALLQLIIDGTRFRADSDRHGARTAKTIEMILRELERRMVELKHNDERAALQTDYLEGTEPQEDQQETLARINQQITQLQNKRAKYQKALGIAQERDARAQKHNGKKAKPVRVPVTDPDSQVSPNKEGGYAPNYTPVATVESQTGAIVHADVLPGSDEASAVMPAVEAAEALTGQKPDAVLADSNFASGDVLDALDGDDIDAYMPTRSASPPDNPALRDDPSTPVAEQDRERLPKNGGQFARTAFVYDPEADVYHCPMGHTLTPYKHGKNKNGVPCTYYQCQACPECPLASDCIKGKSPLRTITRDEHEPLREAAAKRMATDEGQEIYKARAPGIEGVFGFIKAALGIRRFTVRGLENVRTEWTWICTAYNLKKLLALEARSASGGPAVEKRPGSRPPIRPLRCTIRAFGTYFVQMIRHRLLRTRRAPKRYLYMKKAAMA
jgi:transposase